MNEYNIKKSILTFFSNTENGSYFSGEQISDDLGCSRAYVWKYINKLREDGFQIEAVPHLGYRLISSPDKLFGYDFTIGLETKIIGRKNVYHYDKIESTNNRSYELAEASEPEGTIVVAETQTRGKGRIGRSWESPYGSGIYMSIILRPDVETDEISLITLIGALAISKSISGLTGLESRIKWPNDVFLSGRKVCGILTEIKAQPDLVDFIVLGIGINVNTPVEKLPDGATSLFTGGKKEISRKKVIQSVLYELEKCYLLFQEQGFSVLHNSFKELSIVLGEKVKVVEHHKTFTGTAIDIDDKGALLIKTEGNEMKRIFSGDVSLCRKLD